VALLTEPNRRKNSGQAMNPVRPGARRHLLSWGVGECGVCGGRLSLHTRVTARYGKPVTYYRCDEKGCVGRNAAGLDEFVRDVVVERLSRPDALAWLMGDEKEAGMLTDRITELSDLLREAADDYAAKRITRPVFLRLCENYQTDLDVAEEELRRVNTALDFDVLRPLAGPEATVRWDAMMVVSAACGLGDTENARDCRPISSPRARI
jgi:site-specific DNA recombinase